MKNKGQNVVQQLRGLINDELQKITNVSYPNIYKRIQSKEGYKQVEDSIINMVISNNITPSACIAQLESEL